jgi:hypothetical protein
MPTDSARSAALEWLARREAPPPLLERRIRRAIERLDQPADSIVHTLADAALMCLRDAGRGGDQRSTANELLAADAMLTYACEAAAEEGIAALDRLTRELDIARFDALLG